MITMNSQYQHPSNTAAFSVMPQEQQQVQPSPFLAHKMTALSGSMNASSNSSNNSNGTAATFPMKLHAMLSDAVAMHFSDVVCWLPGGQAFKVLDPKRFSEEIMPRYFNQTKYKSFQRQ